MAQENKTPKLSGQDKGDGPRRGPKFSIYWVYGIIAVVLLLMNYVRTSPDMMITTELEFKQTMLANGDVDKVDLIKNKDLVRVYIKQDSLGKKFYLDKLTKNNITREKAKG